MRHTSMICLMLVCVFAFSQTGCAEKETPAVSSQPKAAITNQSQNTSTNQAKLNGANANSSKTGTAAIQNKIIPQPYVYTKPIAEPQKFSLLSPSFDWPTGSVAVWGSLGRDNNDTIYFGVSVDAARDSSASLISLDAKTDQWQNLGNAVANIKTPMGISQNKIHTRIWHAADDYLYFASMDETGELDDGSVMPIYGSHIWRCPVSDPKKWEHLKHVPEGIIASAMGGDGIYFLGYYGHVLYRVDIHTGKIINTRIGATGGHVSRNIIADQRGHVFVPRVRSGEAKLIELNRELDEVAATPLANYSITPNADSHGIVSFATLKNGVIYFTTDGGRLYRIDQGVVRDEGIVHPQGLAYIPCMISPDGETQLHMIGHLPPKGERQYEWFIYDIVSKKITTAPITLPTPEGARVILAYGSMTRDLKGRWYVGGAYKLPGTQGFTPAIWRTSN
jgi:hypothetical protein